MRENLMPQIHQMLTQLGLVAIEPPEFNGKRRPPVALGERSRVGGHKCRREGRLLVINFAVASFQRGPMPASFSQKAHTIARKFKIKAGYTKPFNELLMF
jgi:hypothetical protein